MDGDGDFQVCVPASRIREETTCPICLNPLADALVTPCGHSFCMPCLTACLVLKQKCPCCNAACRLEQCVKNVALNRVIAALADAELSATRKRVEEMFGSSGTASSTSTCELATLLQKHIRANVEQFDEALQGIAARRDQNKKRIRSSHSTCDSMPLSEAEVQQALDECDHRFESCSKFLLAEYETFLSQCSVPPSFLPLRVTVSIPHKPAMAWTLSVRQTDSDTQLMDIITSRLSELGDSIVTLGPDAHFNVRNVFHAGATTESRSCVLRPGQPIGELRLDPGASFELVGASLRLRSDMPKVCFALAFDENDQSQTTNYFTCKTCDLNWVCESCASSCHGGHDLHPFLLDHRPSWGCCYCSKKKKGSPCTLLIAFDD